MPSHTTPCFQTIYRNLHHLLTLRRRLKDELAEAESPAAALDPRLPDALQAALEQLEHETAALRAATPDTEDRQRVLDLLKGRRAELFARADALGTRAWCGEAPDIPDVTACRVRLRYCEHCLAGCRRQIEELRERTALKDPFLMLEEKFSLQDEELDALVHLYHRQFEPAPPITGSELLAVAFPRLEAAYKGQAILFETSNLLGHHLIEVVERRGDPLASTFALSRVANLIISGLHVDYPLQEVAWTVFAAGRGATVEMGKGVFPG